MESIIRTSCTERAKLEFVEALMRYNSTGIGKAMTEHFKAQQTRLPSDKPTVEEIAAVMEPSVPYRFGAFFEFHNHARLFRTLLSAIDRQQDSVRSWLDAINQPGSLGSVELTPDLPPPTYYRSIDIHTQPGNYHAEFAGVLYHTMIGPFLVHRDDSDEMGWALARGIPNRDYRQIVDLGCGVGKSTLPYCDLYPNAEVIGIDYAAAMLKYGHRLAEARSKRVRFLQRHAENTRLPDASADLVVAIWLFHEMPRKARDATVREALRILRPGGVFAIMESPPFRDLRENFSPLSAFLLDSTGRRMSDPYIPEFFQADRVEMFERGGFTSVRDVALPNELTGWGSGDSYFFGAYPWWMTIGEKRADS
jgi:ubiquinone/menaquinone biosynthesis C-methylase UbiE